MGMSSGHSQDIPVTFVRAHVIRRCAVTTSGRLATYVWCPVAGLSPSGTASVATFPRHLVAGMAYRLARRPPL